MADKTISELVAATSVGSTDLFVLEQSNTAKKLTGQILENWLVSFADGHGGIQSIAKTGTSGTNPVIDTYTITLADETTFSFTVTNGLKGDTGAQTYVWIKWAAQNPTADNQLSNNPDKWIGIYSGTASTAPTTRSSYQWYEYKGETGDTGATGASIASITQTGGTGAPGTYDTYTITLDTGVVAGTFQVYNGLDGSGAVSSVNGQTGDVVLTASDVGVSASSATPLTDAGSGVVGTSTAYARGDHRHPLNVSGSAPSPLGTATAGSSGQYARADHVHAMPSASDVGALPDTYPTDWTLAGTSTSSSVKVTYPETAKEIFIKGFSNHGAIPAYFCFVPVSMLSDISVIAVGGYYSTSSDAGLANVDVDASARTLAFRNLRYGNNSTGTYYFYYR